MNVDQLWQDAFPPRVDDLAGLTDAEIQDRARTLLGQLKAADRSLAVHHRRCQAAHAWWLQCLEDRNRCRSRLEGLMEERRRLLAEDGKRRAFVVVHSSEDQATE